MKKSGVFILSVLIMTICFLGNYPMISTDLYTNLRIATDKNVSIYSSNDNIVNFSDPLIESQWGYMTVGANLAHANGVNGTNATGNPVVVAILDTGVDYTHPDLNACYIEGGYDFVNDDNDPMDDNGHGTHCAGIIAAEANNSIGICGIAPFAKIMAYKVLDDSGSGHPDNVTSAINHIVTNHSPKHNETHGVDIISMSFGSFFGDFYMENAIDAAVAEGIILVAAAGNWDYEWVMHPAAYYNVIAISATDIFQGKASYSAYGPEIEYAAPGGDSEKGFLNVGILSTYPGNKYKRFYGTSMATPMAAGVIALLLGNGTAVSNIKAELNSSAKDLGTFGWDKYFGSGMVQIVPNNWNYTAWFHAHYDEQIRKFYLTVFITLAGDSLFPKPLFNPTTIGILITAGVGVAIVIIIVAVSTSKSKY